MDGKPTTTDQQSILPFSILIGGQILSFIGTTLTGIAVGIWVYLQTDSVSSFASLAILTLLPAIIISPFGGVIADKFPRKPTMLFVDSLSALSNMTMLALLLSGTLEIWHLFINAAVNGLSLGMQRPLYESVTPLMVPKHRLASVNGVVQAISGIGQVLAPALAGLLVNLGLQWILIIDLVSFLIAICCILMVRVPKEAGKAANMAQNWFAAFNEGWRFIKDRPGLNGLLWFTAIRSFFFAACEVVIVPLLLIVSSPVKAGIVLSVSGLGIIVGGILMGFLTRKRSLVSLIILAQGVTGVVMLIGGFTTNLVLIAAALAVAFLAFPIEEAGTTTILQRKVPTEILGRVSSVRNMMNMGASPLAMLAIAPLADKVFEPLMRVDGPLSQSVGLLIGTGEGRGMALVLVLTGLATLAVTLLGWRNKSLRNLETNYPDHLEQSDLSEKPRPVVEQK